MKLQTMPEDIQHKQLRLHFEKQLRKSSSEPGIDLEIVNSKADNAHSVKKCSTALKNKHILFEKIIALKDFGLKHFFTEVLLKNIYAFSFLIFIIYLQIYVNQTLNWNLDNTNVLVVLYVLGRGILFEMNYYICMCIYSMKICWPNVSKHLIMFYLISLFIVLLKIYKIDEIDSYVDVYLGDVMVGVIEILFSYKKQVFSWQNFKFRALLMSLLLFSLIFNYYAMKNLIIPEFKQTTLEIQNKIFGGVIFQIALFVYFRIYYKILFITLMMFAKISNNSKEGKDLIVMIAYYYLFDAVCSSTPAAIAEPLNSVGTWIGFFNFLYQILVLYDSNFDIFRNLKILLYKILKRKTTESKSSEQHNQVMEILCVSLNQVHIIVYLQLLLWYFWRRGLNYMDLTSRSDGLIYDYVEIRIENMFVLMFLNFALVLAFFIKKKEPLKIVSTRESYSLLFQIYYIILLHFVCDFELQTYYNLYYLKKT